MRLFLIVFTALALGACTTPEPDVGPETVEMAEAERAMPEEQPSDATPANAEPTGPKTGVEVCQTLMAGLAADARGETMDVSLYATELVLRALYDGNPFAEPGVEAGDIAAWADDEATCNISAGGDAWYELTLDDMPYDDPGGEWATGLDIKTSYD